MNDVALGDTTKQKWNEPDKWIWSKELVHEPLIGIEAFEQVQALHLREEQLLPELDAWLSLKLDPVAFASAVRAFEEAGPSRSRTRSAAGGRRVRRQAAPAPRRARSRGRPGPRHELDERDQVGGIMQALSEAVSAIKPRSAAG